MINPWEFFWLLLKSSLFSTSGTGNMPILHDDLLARGWANEQDFAEALAIGQITPGPTGLWVISFAYLIDGVRGALMALIAVSLPPFTALLAHSILTKYQTHPFARGFVRGLTLAVAAIFVVIISNIMIQTGIDVTSIIIAIGALGLALSKRIPVPVILLIAGAIGAWVYQGA
jgi:chromate transporter